MEQDIRFCTTADGINIAYALAGSGPPLVKVANWLNHLEHDWQSPVWQHLFKEFVRDHQLVRYDERSTGLSDRNATDLSLDALVADLESVVDSLGLDRFPLLAISQGGPVAVAYAARHPEKVSHLILLGSFPAGWRKAGLAPELLAKREAERTLISQGWGSRNPAFRQMWTTLCIPDGTPEEAESFNELQRRSVTADEAVRVFDAIGELDVNELLATIRVPVLVLHARHDALVPFEDGRRMASVIPDAKFVPLDSKNHLLLSHERAWQKFVAEVRNFLGKPLPVFAGDAGNASNKICPNCGKIYAGDQIYFCLDDGTELRPHSNGAGDGPVTQILPIK